MRSMLAHAYHWRVAGFEADIPLSRYTESWGRPGDLALIAMEGGHPIGAAWLRRFTAAARGLRLRRRGDARADDRGRAVTPASRRSARSCSTRCSSRRARPGYQGISLSVEHELGGRRRSTSETASSRSATSTARSQCSSSFRSQRFAEPPPRIVHRARVDRVRDRRLAVCDIGAGVGEQVARGTTEHDRDHRVERSVRDRHRRQAVDRGRARSRRPAGRSPRRRGSPRGAAGPGRAPARTPSPRLARSRRARSARAEARRATPRLRRTSRETSRGRGSRRAGTTYQWAPPGGRWSGPRGV